MTKEQIKQRAEGFIITRQNHIKYFSGEAVKILLKNFAEEIVAEATEELQKQIQIDAEQIRALQKQNGELTEQNTSLLTSVENLNKSVQELEAQIEKMKNCKNCANYMISGKCPSFFRTGWCKNWDLAD